MKDLIDICGESYESRKSLMERYGISAMTLWRWREQGVLPPGVRLGRKLYYPRDEFERRLVWKNKINDNKSTAKGYV